MQTSFEKASLVLAFFCLADSIDRFASGVTQLINLCCLAYSMELQLIDRQRKPLHGT